MRSWWIPRLRRRPRRRSVTEMADRWLILADDLTGAADCAIAFGRRGRAAAVAWGEASGPREPQLPVMAYDAASRGMTAAAAAERHAEILQRLGAPDRIL